MKKSTVFLLSLVSLLSGILVGFLLAPTKGGVRIIGNTSGTNKELSKSVGIEDDLSFFNEDEE